MPFFHFPIPCSYRVRMGYRAHGEQQYIGGTVLMWGYGKKEADVLPSCYVCGGWLI